ncbi:aldehyde reductase [Ponticoccus sp. SC2-23]|uniref:SDR family oxidoreductase n=1 Tax=Alexandriicola marinus TaxID=2081710 RepID=UPI000FD9BDA5|nr:aldehyde reductase [Alexandriicola marinus]MBM1219752.1 aldehyde reductase [Ponticoccus sp. SC6-9]MBM1223176.1 aldehyde reductase [Ponticoccus sp. SC6-15]MBM1229565.1 aldehyde reductase [Ponticoccus sp. SC6-38]MBM1232142.1 aldehyde reductase [Ponticoccus sp. SC6-45]MBM1237908.1 aldehyde reductase [Ponticoccus sp. SC6-49]MBM1241153.1 aldehyde reductase [Ponticoccus sp. SC2-64]MBM1245666.1 aldehyde reductase [Ponticoccus sp. SC6-42]MBM1250144.1 aldehyde reductase [Ponticoccus sp. SC6-33]M
MTKVFLTGASGFIAKHILRELLEQGYHVRASVRSDKRKAELEGLFPDAALEFATLDLTKDDGWQDALKGCDVLIHTASPFPLTEPKDPQDLIRPAVDGTLRAMRAAKDAGIKRVILTSSCAAIYKQADKPKMQPSDEANWTSPDDPAVGAYEASKTLAEKAAWDFVVENPDIALTTINPGAVFGPPMDARYGSSLELVEQLMTGKVPMAPPMDMVAVDVRDVARMHVAAIDLEATKGARFAAASGTHRLLELGQILKAWDQSLKTPGREAPVWLLRMMGLFSKDVKGILGNVGRTLAVSGAKAEKTFGFRFIPVKDALIASAEAVKMHKSNEKNT